MVDFLFNSSVSRETQAFVLDNIQIPGVQSVSMGYTNPAVGLKYLGMGGGNHVYNGQSVGQINLSTYLFSNDFFISYTGTSSSQGSFFLKKNIDDVIYFDSAYLTSYSNNYSLESLPEINVSFSSFSQLGKGINSNINDAFRILDTQHSRIKTIGPGSVNFNNSIFDTNRVNSYSIDITVNRVPIYILGQKAPNEVKVSYPIEINCSFDIDINDYQVKNLTNYPLFPKNDNINLVLNDLFTTENIATYNFGSMLLLNESISSSLDGNTRVRLNYQKFIS